MQLDPESMADLVAVAIKTATAPLVARIYALEQRPQVTPKDGEKGEPGTPGRDGKDADEALIQRLTVQIATLEAELAAKTWPDVDAAVKSAVSEALAQLPTPNDGVDGTSVTVADVEPLIQSAVKQAVSDIPKPQDGRSVTVEDVAPLLESLVTKAVDARPVPKDGVGVVDALVNRDGHLVQTFSDGRTKDVGAVVGRDVDMDAVSQVIAAKVAEAVAQIPRPKDGRDGTLEGVKIHHVDERTFEWQREDGTPVGRFRADWVLDKGVFRDDAAYVKGDGVTFGGSFFIAQKDEPGKPEVGDGWRLAVKRGRDGRNGRDVAPGPRPPVKING